MNSARSPLLLGVCASFALHALVYLVMRWAGSLPDIGLQITLPANVEFGLADATPMPPPSAPPPAAQSPAAQPLATTEIAAPKPPGDQTKKKKKKKPPEPVDAGTPSPAVADASAGDLAHLADAAITPALATKDRADAGNPLATHDKPASAPALSAYAPSGAQLALRVDMQRVRASALANDARDLLEAIPDFAALLRGSGVRPVDDLSRLFLASPNLDRASLVVAGSYEGGETAARHAVAALAEARAKKARWRMQQGIAVAPWENDDVTPRVLALIGPSLFAITRPDDLPRVLAVARALARRAHASGAAASPVTDAEGLLAMEAGEAVALSVENAPSFVQGQVANVPERIRISIRLPDDAKLDVITTGVFPSPELAEKARAFWQNVRDQFARHPLVAMVGMSEPLRETQLETHELELVAHTTLSLDQVRMILGFARGALVPRTPRTSQLPSDLPTQQLPFPRQRP